MLQVIHHLWEGPLEDAQKQRRVSSLCVLCLFKEQRVTFVCIATPHFYVPSRVLEPVSSAEALRTQRIRDDVKGGAVAEGHERLGLVARRVVTANDALVARLPGPRMLETKQGVTFLNTVHKQTTFYFLFFKLDFN